MFVNVVAVAISYYRLSMVIPILRLRSLLVSYPTQMTKVIANRTGMVGIVGSDSANVKTTIWLSAFFSTLRQSPPTSTLVDAGSTSAPCATRTSLLVRSTCAASSSSSVACPCRWPSSPSKRWTETHRETRYPPSRSSAV